MMLLQAKAPTVVSPNDLSNNRLENQSGKPKHSKSSKSIKIHYNVVLLFNLFPKSILLGFM